MEQFAASVNKFLAFNDYRILPDNGRISADKARAKAESEYNIFNKTQRIDSDFDKQVRGMLGGKNDDIYFIRIRLGMDNCVYSDPLRVPLLGVSFSKNS